MTDEQIIKNAERHKLGSCSQCDYKNYGSNCLHELLNDSIKLSNRQKAEIEGLNVELKAMRGAANSYKLELERKEDELHRAKVEISKHFDYMNSATNEAIKEFAERLKEIIYTHENRVDVDGIVLLTRIDNSIDNLVKEMTEVDK